MVGRNPQGPSLAYTYVPAAPRLVQGFASGSTVGTLNAWEPNRDVLDYKQNTFGGSIISKYDYTVNDMSHRSAVAETGSAYAGSPSVGWGYNSRGEVTLHDHTTGAYDSVYEFDTIGNRTKAAAGTTLPGSPTHASNNLNQYTTIGGVSPGYDDDGNLTSDAGGNTHGSARTYQWNAENQLRQVSSGAVADYRYDPHGRRISKTAGGVTTWFIYDGWILVAEYQGGTLNRAHLWGLDLSGTTQGAGGVGGLLCTTIGGTKYYPLYDGNGNICQYLDGSGGTAAHYEYGPFGHLLNTPGTGSTPVSFNFRFSTKFNDPETDFYYYGYRYYSSWMARWINRDPIGEIGGINTIALSKNDLINLIDRYGFDVTMSYSISRKKLTIKDNQTGKTASCEFHSGDDDSRKIGIPNVGPIPPGNYNIYPRPQSIAGNQAFILDPNDSKPRNDKIDDGSTDSGKGRSEFRLHIEVLQNANGSATTNRGSNGCIVGNKKCLDKMAKILNATEKGAAATITTPPFADGTPAPPFENVPYLGQLTVTQ